MLCYLMLLENDADRAAFSALYDRYGGLLLKTAYGWFPGDPGRAEDAVHSAFLSVAKNFLTISLLSDAETLPYLVTIVKNACRDILRKEKKYVLMAEQCEIARGLAPKTEELSEPYRRAVELICTLPDKYRQVLECRLLLGYTNVETARRLGQNQRTISSRYQRGRDLVAEQLTKEGLGLGAT